MLNVDDFIHEKSILIRNDKDNSASFLSGLTLKFIEEFISNEDFYQNRTELLQGLSKFSNALCKAKPLMGAVYNHCHSVLDFIEELPKHERNIGEIKKLVLDHLNKQRELVVQVQSKITSLGCKLVINHNNIFTLSYSGYVRDTLLQAKKNKKRFTVKVLESSPRKEGIQLAEELAKKDIKCIIYPDADVVSAVSSSTFVLLGCDRITETSFINKTGSYAAAIVARNFDIPVYILADTAKILLKRQYLMRIDGEENTEIYGGNSDNISVTNHYFEETPIEYISKVVTEAGIFETEEFIKRFLS